MGFGGHFQQVKGNELFCEIDDNYLEKLLESVINREESHFIHQVPQHYDAAQNLANFVCECNHFCDGPCVYYHENLSYYENHICNGKSEPAHPFIYSKQEAMMYGLIHARYIMTNVGIDKMKEKYLEGEFGYCPRVYCENQPLLPMGLSDILKKCTVKMYCPKCEDLYHPRSTRFHSIDGSYFGTSFPHMFLMAYPELRPKPAKFFYEPLLYGFKIHPEAKHLQLQKAEIANPSTKMEKKKGKQGHTTDDEFKRTPYMIMKPQKKISKSLEMNETIDLKQIIEAYNMKLLPKYEIPFGTRKIGSIAKCDITEILDMLLLFLDTQEVSTKKIIDLVFNLDHQSPILSMLYKYKSYKFPDNYDDECFAHLFQKPLYNMFRNNLQTLADDIKNMLKTTGEVNPQNDSVQHNTVKAILKDYFGKITEEGVLSNNGACHASLTFEQTQPTRATTTRKKGSLYEVVAVTPDLVIGQFNGHATIPVEVYSHHTHNDDVSSPDESPALLSDEEFVSIHKFLSQEVPAFNTPKTCSDDFKKQITKQLLLQLVALTALYLGEKSEYKHRRAFLGLFAVNCNFYILKLQGYEEDFNKLGQCPTRQKRFRMKDSITVQYFPLPLDISIPHHGIALQIFLRYYRNFYKI